MPENPLRWCYWQFYRGWALHTDIVLWWSGRVEFGQLCAPRGLRKEREGPGTLVVICKTQSGILETLVLSAVFFLCYVAAPHLIFREPLRSVISLLSHIVYLALTNTFPPLPVCFKTPELSWSEMIVSCSPFPRPWLEGLSCSLLLLWIIESVLHPSTFITCYPIRYGTAWSVRSFSALLKIQIVTMQGDPTGPVLWGTCNDCISCHLWLTVWPWDQPLALSVSYFPAVGS